MSFFFFLFVSFSFITGPRDFPELNRRGIHDDDDDDDDEDGGDDGDDVMVMMITSAFIMQHTQIPTYSQTASMERHRRARGP